MRIVINIKCRGREVTISPRLDQSAHDDINEINAGHALFARLEGLFGTMETKAVRRSSSIALRVMLWSMGVIVAGYTLACLWPMTAKWLAK